MKRTLQTVMIPLFAMSIIGCNSPSQTSAGGENGSPGSIVQYGKMREVIGGQKHHGRILLSEVATQPNLFAVGALEGLNGEFTILDAKVYATQADSPSEITPCKNTEGLQAALLAGFQVPAWNELEIGEKVAWDDFELFIESKAKDLGIDTSNPFPFVIAGGLENLEIHVIRGACPVHSNRNGIKLSEHEQPFEHVFPKLSGTLVGIFAKGAAGDLTHPGTMTHTHVIFDVDDGSGLKLTGHVDSVAIGKGGTLRLPKFSDTKTPD